MSTYPGHTGALGGVGRCHKFWLGFSQCLTDSKDPGYCVLQREDYMECLHRRKLKRRVAKVLEAREVAKNPEAAAASKSAHH